MQGRYKKEQIAAWLQEWKLSGKSAKEFSIDKPFHCSTLDYWRRKSTKELLPNSFISISNPVEIHQRGSAITLTNGVVINLGYQLNITQLKELVV